MEKYLRDWRQDATKKHQYESAIFVADKLLGLTNKDEDAFFLAHLHFSTGNYSRAQSILSRGHLVANNASCRYLTAHCSIKLGKVEEALQTLGDKNPTHLIPPQDNARQKLRHVDLNTRLGAKHYKPGARSDRLPTSEERDREDVGNLKFEAGMCYLRGLCYAKNNSFDRAKECYKTAVQIDVQCFEAFDELMTNALMSPEEEWKFLDLLNFDTINVDNNPSLSQEAAQFTKTLYTTRLSKYSNPAEFTAATETLSTHYNLASNADILLSKADLMFTQCRFREALAMTSSILEHDKYNFATIPVHLACLHELGQKNELFLLAHELADSHPQESCTWFAVGVYYLSINRIAESRRYFSKSSMMDPHFGPAWIGFAHTFAAEGEHDQAISAYSTAARLFQGTHLPQLFLGMQNLQLNQMQLAHEYFNTAYQLCRIDPLLLNELGVVFYHEDSITDAIQMFRRALAFAEKNDSDKEAWIPTRTNLAHALRRVGDLEGSLAAFDEVLRLGHKDAGVFAAKGLVLLECGRSWDAVITLHEALAVAPQDTMATDLLNRALEAHEADVGANGTTASFASAPDGMSDDDVGDMDQKIESRLREIQQNRVAGRGGRRGRRNAGGLDDMSGFGESMMVDSDG
ncbi:anaphase-promoting complex subunit Cut9 [Polyplosphaeria fusca]|uniref:Anaphase-promoting complex subunit Cut9 n=1 Tax=Polyplosphaeria fusca TaxID=682080 RepID=A0A9P4UYN5_9PLEO|nr:anaphase-promoting complex subunit Cut9 [Polyplosphaeria fusca]